MKSKGRMILWIGIIITAIYILATALVCIIHGEKAYYFSSVIMQSCIHPGWCIISVSVFVIQTVLVTILILSDAKNKNKLKRDLIATTILGLVCLVLCLAPSAKGCIILMSEIPDEPECFEYNENDLNIIICRKNGKYDDYYDVYLLNSDDSLLKTGSFSGDLPDHDFRIESDADTITVCYDDDMGSERKKTFHYDKGQIY